MEIINVENLVKVYKSHRKEPGLKGSIQNLFKRETINIHALCLISFVIQKGEFVGYIGSNGAGKTTTMKILSGILYPTNGKVEVLGYIPYKRKKEFLKRISFVMGQKGQLWWDLPSIETFLLNKEIYNIPKEQFGKILEELTDLLNVSHLINIPV